MQQDSSTLLHHYDTSAQSIPYRCVAVGPLKAFSGDMLYCTHGTVTYTLLYIIEDLTLLQDIFTYSNRLVGFVALNNSLIYKKIYIYLKMAYNITLFHYHSKTVLNFAYLFLSGENHAMCSLNTSKYFPLLSFFYNDVNSILFQYNLNLIAQ